MSNYDYFKQYCKEMERINAQTAHERHVEEFQAMCAKMISDAIPDIKRQGKEEIALEHKSRKRETEDIDIRIDVKDVKKKVMDAIRKAFS